MIFALGLIFSGTNPLIGIFVATFFAFKYWIEKYNLTFVYSREFEGGGVIKKQVVPFMVLSIYLFQLLNIGYFTIFNDSYFKGGLIFLVIESLALIFLHVQYKNKKKQSREELALLEENTGVGGCYNQRVQELMKKLDPKVSDEKVENTRRTVNEELSTSRTEIMPDKVLGIPSTLVQENKPRDEE